MSGHQRVRIRRKLTGAVIATLALGLGVGWSTAAGAARVAATSADGLPVFGPGKDYHPTIDPANFSPNVTNPYFPLEPGTVYVYGGTESGKSAVNVMTVTSKTKVIDGVTTRVIEDRVFVNGRLEERTRDYYTQDKAGNVWYFGEDTGLVNKHGKITSGAGSWHSGVDGAEAGVYMQANPELNRRFRQEWYKGHAEDQFKAVSLSTSITVPYVSSKQALKTEETTALEPKTLDNKIYVKGIGQVVERSVKGPEETLVLVDVIHAS